MPAFQHYDDGKTLMRFPSASEPDDHVHAGLQVDVVRTTQFAEFLSSTKVGVFRASAERRIPRLDGLTFLFGTAILVTPNRRAKRSLRAFDRERLSLDLEICALIHAGTGFDQSPQGFFRVNSNSGLIGWHDPRLSQCSLFPFDPCRCACTPSYRICVSASTGIS